MRKVIQTKDLFRGIAMSSIKTLGLVQRVAIAIPFGKFMKKIANDDTLLNCWRSGVFITDERFVINKFFYGIEPNDFGETITASVMVIEKNLDDGRVFLHLDICVYPKVKNEQAEYRVKFPKKTNVIDNPNNITFDIPESKHCILFHR